MIAKIDDKGRIYLPKEIREKFNSKEFYIVDLPYGIVLIPKLRDPIKALEEEGKKLPNLDIKELKRIIREEAEKEVGIR
ncbi:AbrB/MazE/SpoVT family DNA-binding domain-containing protein [Sulfurisphaera tokodaii]|uniref:AbrB/MazE/SpoVT family DNA-binding domain-containing protein n=1 Tax=Sulfurisphaera tokodaii TaxID=111955 RepID=A0A832T0S7_9CREN|nr:AbrB/MazE/SpoVT family DNA-binding domain-containing protein [Sulfurisphaera tokodaii]HII73197.1 AbrB/MazE/SpoVT family DNA-binding domain-containing protein [Sulfurisphaera tokodaii]